MKICVGIGDQVSQPIWDCGLDFKKELVVQVFVSLSIFIQNCVTDVDFGPHLVQSQCWI